MSTLEGKNRQSLMGESRTLSIDEMLPTNIASTFTELMNLYNPTGMETGQFNVRFKGEQCAVSYRKSSIDLLKNLKTGEEQRTQQMLQLREFLTNEFLYANEAGNSHETLRKLLWSKGEVDCSFAAQCVKWNVERKKVGTGLKIKNEERCKFRHETIVCDICHFREWNSHRIDLPSFETSWSIQAKGGRRREIIVAPKFTAGMHKTNIDGGQSGDLWRSVLEICRTVCKLVHEREQSPKLSELGELIQSICLNFGQWEKNPTCDKWHTHFHLVLKREAAESIDQHPDDSPLSPLIACNLPGDAEYLHDWSAASQQLNMLDFGEIGQRFQKLELRFDNLELRFDDLELRFEARFTNIESGVAEILRRLAEMATERKNAPETVPATSKSDKMVEEQASQAESSSRATKKKEKRERQKKAKQDKKKAEEEKQKGE